MTHSFTAGKRDGTTILKLSGPLTISTMFGFQNELRAVKAEVLIIDLSETPYMDSAGLGLIMNSHVSAQDRGGKMPSSAMMKLTHAYGIRFSCG